MKYITITSKTSMNRHIKGLDETDLRGKDFDFSKNPIISSNAKILSTEINCKNTNSKYLDNNENLDQQIIEAPHVINSQKSKTFQSNEFSRFKLSSNIPRNKPKKLFRSSPDQTMFTAEEDDSLLASINSEIEKLEDMNEKLVSKTCPACSDFFENSICMINHYYAFHQDFN